jgi:hypothetical protein
MMYWTIAGHRADALQGEAPELNPGAEPSMSFVFRPSDAATPYNDRANAVLGIALASDEAEYGISDVTREPWFREKVRDDAPVNNIVVQIAPEDEAAAQVPAFWAVVTGYSESTQRPGIRRILELDLFVIALVSDYPTRTDLEAAFSDTLV